jgi:hypothetical protein
MASALTERPAATKPQATEASTSGTVEVEVRFLALDHVHYPAKKTKTEGGHGHVHCWLLVCVWVWVWGSMHSEGCAISMLSHMARPCLIQACNCLCMQTRRSW